MLRLNNMVSYAHEARFQIENVDHEMHILGLKLANLSYLAWGFLSGSIIAGAPFGLGVMVFVIVLSRWMFALEKAGTPLTFNPRVSRILRRIPLGLYAFDYLAAIEPPRPAYRS